MQRFSHILLAISKINCFDDIANFIVDSFYFLFCILILNLATLIKAIEIIISTYDYMDESHKCIIE